MKKFSVILLIILILLIAERIFFNTTDLKVEIEPDHLYTAPDSELHIDVIPLNTLDIRNPLGKANVVFEIEEGKLLADIIETTPSSAKIRSKGIGGEIQVGIYSAKSGILIKRIMIKIYGSGLAEIIENFCSILFS